MEMEDIEICCPHCNKSFNPMDEEMDEKIRAIVAACQALVGAAEKLGALLNGDLDEESGDLDEESGADSCPAKDMAEKLYEFFRQ
jgi:hypothetical protein